MLKILKSGAKLRRWTPNVHINFNRINLVIHWESLQVFKVAKSGDSDVPCVDIQFRCKSFAYLKKTHHCFSYTLQMKIKFIKVRGDVRKKHQFYKPLFILQFGVGLSLSPEKDPYLD